MQTEIKCMPKFQINLKSEYIVTDISEKIQVELSLPDMSAPIASVVIHDDCVAEIMIHDEDAVQQLPIVNHMMLIARVLTALVNATTADTQIPLCVDTSFQL